MPFMLFNPVYRLFISSAVSFVCNIRYTSWLIYLFFFSVQHWPIDCLWQHSKTTKKRSVNLLLNSCSSFFFSSVMDLSEQALQAGLPWCQGFPLSVDPATGSQHTFPGQQQRGSCCYLGVQLHLKGPDHPCPAVSLPALTAVICRWLSLALFDVGLGVSSIKKSLKLRESMVG